MGKITDSVLYIIPRAYMHCAKKGRHLVRTLVSNIFAPMSHFVGPAGTQTLVGNYFANYSGHQHETKQGPTLLDFSY